MSAFRKWTIGVTLTAAIGLGAAWLLGVDAQNPPVAKCYLGHLSTDKPIYRTGEVVYLRSVVLGALDHQPMSDSPSGGASLQITGPRGEQIFNQWSTLQDSVSAFAWPVPPDTSGGQYTAQVSFPSFGYPPAERRFEIRAYRAPRLKGEIVFMRDGFGAGDTVKASMHVERAEGGLPVGSTVAATADVDGATVYSGATTIDSAGNCAVQFPLPGKISVGDGTLSLAVTDGGVVEPITKTIPILVNSINLGIYPEGGDLIAGLPNRVYIESKTPSQKPADISAVVVDAKGRIVAELKTEHEGRGRFDITPEAGAAYSIRILQPSGIHHEYRLPNAKAAGVVIRSESEVTPADAPIKLDLSAAQPGKYTLVLSKRETEAASIAVDLTSQMTTVSLTPPRWADGVLIATVKQADGTPVAERLVYRDAGRSLHVKVTPDRTGYVPGDAVSVTVTTTDDDGHPVAAVVGLTATDQSVLQMIEKRERSPHLPAMVLLEDDVKELADAEIYLDRNDPKSAMATDLLLGTQGWRRFASANTVSFLTKEGDLGRRVLADLQPAVQLGPWGGRGGGGGMVFDAAMPVAVAAPHGVALVNKAAEEEKHAGRARGLDADKHLGVAKQEMVDRRVMAKRQLQSMADMSMPPVVREYAHQIRSDQAADDRTDFAETVYWSAGIKTDEKTGTANVKFNLSDSVTSFDVTADAFDAAGRLGQATTNITANQPFYIEPKLPLEVTSGDVIHLPLAAVNATTQPADQIKLTMTTGDNITVGQVEPFNLTAGQRLRRTIDLKIGDKPGSSDFAIWAHNDLFSDKVTRTLVVKPMGFPTEITKGGTVAAKSKVIHEIVIPDSLIAGSMTASATLYPTPLANLTEALQRLLQEPNGCFEQTSSTTYPLIMADQYFNSHTGVDPALIARSNDLLQKGYDKLKGFECSNKGYEWFGEDPGHECLSAYGLMEFTDMSAVRNVDGGMVANTRKWLLARRDGKGGYSHERRSLHTWIVDPGCANGYCTWALLETGEKNLDKEVDWLRADATSESNSYVKALAANALFLAGDKAGAKQFMDQLASLQDADGHVKGATTTVVGSGGESLEIETTSLATLAWLRDPAYAGHVESAIRYLADSCKGGRFGSTQSTVLALRAIIAYDKARAHPTAAGNIQLVVDNEPVGEPIPFDAATTGAIKLPDFSARLNPGKHAVELRMGDGSDLPYSIAVTFNSITPASADQCKLAMTTALAEPNLAEGAVSEVKVSVTNKTGDTLPTPIAIIGLPGGLEVRHDQLKELVKAERIAAYEVRGREVILYWRDIQPNQTIELPISVTAAIPGEYTGPASRVYLYYTDEFKQWLPGLKAAVH